MRKTLLVFVAACGVGSKDGASGTDAGGTNPGDAPAGCHGGIIFAPNPATTGDGIARATAFLQGYAGVPTYVWTVNGGTDFTMTGTSNEWVEFSIATAGSYDVHLRFDDTGNFCDPADATLNVSNGGPQDLYRLRVRSGALPPQEHPILLPPGAPTYNYGDFAVSAGLAVHPTLTHGAAPVPAYVKLMPQTAPDEIVEAFAGSDGGFPTTITAASHYVLVVPSVPGIAPQLILQAFQGNPSPTIALATGTAISGTVLGPTGAPLAGAHVQLSIGDVPDALVDTLAGVPSTLTTTAADGTFTVLAVIPPGNPPITVDVVPPAGSGLPRLAATGAFGSTIAIAYASTMAPRDLAGAVVSRAAQVTLVGTIANAGTIAGSVATGSVLATAHTDAAGTVPTLKAPPVGLSAVIDTDAVVAIDMATPPATIAAPAPAMTTSIITDAGGSPIAGLVVDAAPLGTLALAGAQPLRATSTTDGVAFALASGGGYELRISDPQNRFAPLTASPAASIALPKTTIVSGTISVSGQGTAPDALVQVMCGTCTGVARTRPLASTTTDGTGAYHYAVATPP